MKLSDKEEGDIVIDVVKRQTSAPFGTENDEKVVILLHGITGHSDNYHMQLMVDELVKGGFNTISLNHYGVHGEKNCRLMNYCKQKYLDEVI